VKPVHKSQDRLLLAALLILPAVLGAQEDDLRLPISLDADSTAYDGNSSMLVFEGLRLTQGSIGVEADEGRASKLDFQDSIWRFEGNVVIDVENGHIECDAADLRFANHELRFATITGSPATFEVRRPGSEETTYAEAGLLEYNLETGVIEFSRNAVFTEGGNQIASSFIAYNISERRINAQSSGEGDDKVKITFTPQATEQTHSGGQPAETVPEDEDEGP
jgi:lipopolysaccharide transport protein LptA